MIRNDNESAPVIMAGQETVARVSLNLIVFRIITGFVSPGFVSPGFVSPGFVSPGFVRTMR